MVNHACHTPLASGVNKPVLCNLYGVGGSELLHVSVPPVHVISGADLAIKMTNDVSLSKHHFPLGPGFHRVGVDPLSISVHVGAGLDDQVQMYLGVVIAIRQSYNRVVLAPCSLGDGVGAALSGLQVAPELGGLSLNVIDAVVVLCFKPKALGHFFVL